DSIPGRALDHSRHGRHRDGAFALFEVHRQLTLSVLDESKQHMRKNIPSLRAVALALITSCACLVALGSQPAVWEMGSRAELLKGEARGVSITDNGVITLAPRLDQVFN